VKTKMEGDWLFKAVPFFIGFVFLLIICVIGASIYAGTKVFKELDGCTPAVVTSQKDGQTQTSIECKK
jgi:hypothetical protein